MERLSNDILETIKPIDETVVNSLLEQEIEKHSYKIIVLDDDPTGVQTVHGVSVYTDWKKESIKRGFEEDNRVFYILTNSRGLTEAETIKVHQDIAQNVCEVAKTCGSDYLLVSRGDSTLRGHYPLETEIMKDVLEKEEGKKVDGEILCPFFKEGGRFTIGDVHYVRDGDVLIPAGQTEFAKDKTFGYEASDLKDYIVEKTKGTYSKEQVISIGLETIRDVEIDRITQQLMQVTGFQKVIVNAVDLLDVRVFCIALYRAIARGKTFLYRVAAPFVQALGNISKRPLLSKEEMITKNAHRGGVVIVGSHTLKTTKQFEMLKTLKNVVTIEMDSDLVLKEGMLEKEAMQIVAQVEKEILAGNTVAVATKRQVLTVDNDTKEAALVRSVKISEAVQSIVGELTIEPSFVVAKGGITSSDIGTKALEVVCAMVMGQIRPGIPVWQTGTESKFPGMPYIIFPGNVGDVEDLYRVVKVLSE